jgi:hypothetical protein
VVREALRGLLVANNGGAVDDRAVETLNRATGRTRLEVRFGADGRAALGSASGEADGALGRIQAAVQAGMEEGTWGRLKACANAGCTLDRGHTLHRSIVLHTAPGISPAELPEVLLLEAGVACDVSGARSAEISRRAMREVVARYSRADFKREFTALLGREARRKPDCSTALLFGRGLGRRIEEADLPDN